MIIRGLKTNLSVWAWLRFDLNFVYEKALLWQRNESMVIFFFSFKFSSQTRFIFKHLTHAWKIHSQGFYSNSRWNAPVPGFKWKHCIVLITQKEMSRWSFFFSASNSRPIYNISITSGFSSNFVYFRG
jgi:hypothetical protein